MERLEPSLAYALPSIGFTPSFTPSTPPSWWALTGKLTGNAHLAPKRFIDLTHHLLLHRR